MQEQVKKRKTREEVFWEFFKDWTDTVEVTNRLYPEERTKYEYLEYNNETDIRKVIPNPKYPKTKYKIKSKARPFVNKVFNQLKPKYLEHSKKKLKRYFRKKKGITNPLLTCYRANLNIFFDELNKEGISLSEETQESLKQFFEKNEYRNSLVNRGKNHKLIGAFKEEIDENILIPYLLLNEEIVESFTRKNISELARNILEINKYRIYQEQAKSMLSQQIGNLTFEYLHTLAKKPEEMPQIKDNINKKIRLLMGLAKSLKIKEMSFYQKKFEAINKQCDQEIGVFFTDYSM